MTANITQTQLRIPYGVADFVKLRLGNEYYVDKTHFLPLLESAGRLLFLIRPRRFGKSLLQSMMECYYDRRWAEQFDELFQGTSIAANPTPERGRYLILRFDFSVIDARFDNMRASFDAHIRIELDVFFERFRKENLQSLVGIGKPPRDLIDHNVRIDYGKLRHLIQIDRRLNGNFSRLREIIESVEQVGGSEKGSGVNGTKIILPASPCCKFFI